MSQNHGIMTIPEARIIALWQAGEHYSASRIGTMARAVWGDEAAEGMCDKNMSHTLGTMLVRTAERVLDLHKGDLESMEMCEVACTSCTLTHVSLHYVNPDTMLECPHCREMACPKPAWATKERDE